MQCGHIECYLVQSHSIGISSLALSTVDDSGSAVFQMGDVETLRIDSAIFCMQSRFSGIERWPLPDAIDLRGPYRLYSKHLAKDFFLVCLLTCIQFKGGEL